MASVEPIPFQWRTRTDGTRYKAAVPGSRWKARYRDANRRTRSKTFDRKIDAERFAERNGADLQRAEWIDPRSASRSFDELGEKWWAGTTKLQPQTRRCYWQLYSCHVLPHFTGMSQGSIDWMAVEDFVNEKIRAGYNAKRVRDMVSIISLIMKLAIRAGYRKDNPALGHQMHARENRITSSQVLTMEQAHRLVACTRDPYKPAVWLFVLGGLRPAELCGLTVGDLDFARGRMHVHETINYINGFDGGHAQVHRGPVKTDAGDRTIPVPQDICDDIAAMLQARAERRGTPIVMSEPLFESIKGCHPLKPTDMRRRIILPALEAAGLPTTFRTYDLRHTMASLLIEQGVSILEVAQRMGHSDPSVTLRVYGHIYEGAQQRLTDTLDALRQASAPSDAGGRVVDLAEHRRAR